MDLPLEELRRYRPPLTRPEDFGRFWADGRDESRACPLNVRFDRDTTRYPVRQWTMTFDGFRGGRVHGRLVLPEAGERMPVTLLLHGYHGYRASLWESLAWAAAGIGTLALDIRGQDEPPVPGSGDRFGRGSIVLGLDDPEHYYYRTVYLDALRALQALREHPDVDGTRLAAAGISQGGGLSLVLAALDGGLLAAVAGAPFMAHIPRAVETCTAPPYDEVDGWFEVHDPMHEQEREIYHLLSYFDAMNFCPDAVGRVTIAVGLQDGTCPPATAFACYNHLTCSEKALWVYPEADHKLPPLFWDSAMATVCEALGLRGRRHDR